MQPACVYDIKASWADNMQQGPQWAGPVPDRQLPPPTQWFDFLGHKVSVAGFCGLLCSPGLGKGGGSRPDSSSSRWSSLVRVCRLLLVPRPAITQLQVDLHKPQRTPGTAHSSSRKASEHADCSLVGMHKTKTKLAAPTEHLRVLFLVTSINLVGTGLAQR